MRPSIRPFVRAHRSTSLGLWLRRDPRLWWLAVGACALTVGLIVSSIVGAADRTRAAWGRSQRVLVATHELAPGDRIHRSDVTLVDRPTAMVPASALRRLPDGAIARSTILAGEVVVEARLTSGSLSAVAARLPPGTRAIAIPVEVGSAPPLEPGDLVDVLVALPPELAAGRPPGFAIATDALVVALDDGAVTIAVPRATAPRIAVALGQGAVTLALVGAESG